jgi:EmrB/QacA subfamily drug resistance transporter
VTADDAAKNPTTPARRHPSPGWAVLTVCCLAQFMIVLDVSIVNVALPSMQGSLHLSGSELAWVLNAYTLTFAGFLLCGGRAADLVGRKKVFVIGLGAFTLASLLGGLAQAGGELVAARALQGLGGAVLAPSTLSLLTTTFTTPASRARALGAWSATAAGGGAFGVIAGGILTDIAGWRWVLFINVPIGVLLAVAGHAVLTESRGQVRGIRELDLPGAVLVTAGLVALVTAIVRTGTHAWDSGQTLLTLALAVVFLTAFVLAEGKARHPLVPLGFFRRRSASTANVIAMLLGAALFGMFYFTSLYMQDVLQYSPLKTGLAFLPSPLALAVGAQASARLTGRLPAKALLAAGSLLTGGALTWFGALPEHGSYLAHILVPMAIFGLGLGTTMVQVTIAATAGVPPQLAGLASGLVNTGRQVGAAVGLAILETVAASETTHVRAAGGTLSKALTQGYDRGLLVAGFFMLAAVAVAATLPGKPASEVSGDIREGAAQKAAEEAEASVRAA